MNPDEIISKLYSLWNNNVLKNSSRPFKNNQKFVFQLQGLKTLDLSNEKVAKFILEIMEISNCKLWQAVSIAKIMGFCVQSNSNHFFKAMSLGDPREAVKNKKRLINFIQLQPYDQNPYMDIFYKNLTYFLTKCGGNFSLGSALKLILNWYDNEIRSAILHYNWPKNQS